MAGPLAGVRVVEVAAWTFVPGAGAVLGDLGADVIKVEPLTGDPQRGLKNLLNVEREGPNPFVEIPNHGKRSIAVDLSTEGGHEVLLKLVETADVFLTSYLPPTRVKLRIDVEDLRAVNPALIYARGSGWGARGPLAEQAGFDSVAAWAAGGVASRLTDPDAEHPLMQPAAFYDLQGSSNLAGAISAALFKRERTGVASVVDVSLMAMALWSLGPDMVSAPYVGPAPRYDRYAVGNPLVNWYRTSDDRWVHFSLLQSDRYWPELCEAMGRPDLVDDPRFSSAALRSENRAEVVRTLDAVFASADMAEWRSRLASFSGAWSIVLTPREVHDHPQVEANDLLPTVTGADGHDFRLVAPPMQFDDGASPVLAVGAPEAGQHTDELLLELGYDWEQIVDQKVNGAVL